MEKHLAFISHAHQYSSIAQEICNRLEENGVSCWIAPRNITSGDWAGSIMNGLAHSDIFILIVGEYSISSPECLKELTEATHTCSYIIPFKIDNTDLTLTMKYHLGPIHWLDASNPPLEQHIDELVQRVLNISDEETFYHSSIDEQLKKLINAAYGYTVKYRKLLNSNQNTEENEMAIFEALHSSIQNLYFFYEQNKGCAEAETALFIVNLYNEFFNSFKRFIEKRNMGNEFSIELQEVGNYFDKLVVALLKNK